MTERAPRPSKAATIIGLTVTNITKLVGLWLAIHTIQQPNPSFLVLAAEMFMLTGAQATEEQVLKFLARVFGGPMAATSHERKPGDDS